MNIRIALITVLLGLSFSAGAEIVTIVRAYEIAISDLRLPGNTAGTISAKECAACEPQIIRVTAQTRYVLNGKDLPLNEFRVAINSIREKKTNISTVMHHLESDTVTAVMVVKK